MSENCLSRASCCAPRDAFMPSLLLSFILHLLFFGIRNSPLQTPPRYALARAPVSMEIVLVEASSFSDQQSVPKDHPSLQGSRVEDAAAPGFFDEAAVTDRNRKSNIVLPSLEKPYNRIPPGAVTRARPLSGIANPAPVYPALARKQGWEGTVIVKAFVQADGLPGRVMVEKSSGHHVLDNAASETIRRWKFEPAGKGSREQASWVAIPVRFALVDE